MALQKTLSLQGATTFKAYGIVLDESTSTKDFADAYIKVEKVDGTKTAGVAHVSFTSGSVKWTRKFDIPLSSSDDANNFIKQAYEHLKTLSEFSGATDV